MNIKQPLTASDLMNFHYCQRIPYYVHVLRIPQATTRKELKGREKYEHFKRGSRRTKLIPELPRFEKHYDTHLESEELGMLTKADCIAINRQAGEAYPVQAKYARRPRSIYSGMRAQLEMEGLLIEKTLGLPAPRGYIKFLKDGKLATVDLHGKGRVLRDITAIREMITEERMPSPTAHRKRCTDCCYRKLCWGG